MEKGTMISRRRFLIIMTFLAATNKLANASNKPAKTSFISNDSRELCVYKGWVLRTNDLNDIQPGE